MSADHEVVTFTFFPGLSHPQRLTSLCCCITMPSLIRCGSFTFALLPKNIEAAAANIKNRLFILSSLVFGCNITKKSVSLQMIWQKRLNIEQKITLLYKNNEQIKISFVTSLCRDIHPKCFGSKAESVRPMA